MKHAKKMILVEAPNEQNEIIGGEKRDLVSKKSFSENYLKTDTIFNLDQELKRTLNRTDLDDHEKWILYNQSLQRFLFFLNEERKNNSLHKVFQTSFNKAPSHDTGTYFQRKEAPYFRKPLPGVENIEKMNIPQNYKNVKFDRGQYNINPPVQTIEEKEKNNISQSETLYESAYDTTDEREEYDNNDMIDSLFAGEEDKVPDNNETKKRGKKRETSITHEINTKRRRVMRKPLYNYSHNPPLNRWLLELKQSKNKNRIKRVLNALNREISRNSYKTGKIIRSDRRAQLSAPYRKEVRGISLNPRVVVNRLPVNLNKEVIDSLISGYNTKKTINKPKWESLSIIKSLNKK